MLIRMERLRDKLIGHRRTVEVAGIDMVHAGLYCLAQNSNCRVKITWWSPHLRASKLHCTIAHAVHGHGCARQREAASEISLFNHSVPPGTVHYLYRRKLKGLSHQFFAF